MLPRRLAVTVIALALAVAGCSGKSGGTTDPGAVDAASDHGADPGTPDPGASDPVADPGAMDQGGDSVAPAGSVALNEVMHSPGKGLVDWVEIYNLGSDEADISGWILRDSSDTHSFAFPPGTSLAAGGFVLVYGKGGTATYNASFGFGDVDSARLFLADGKTIEDSTSWTTGQGVNGQSWGRYPDGTGQWQALATPTAGMPNKQ